MSDLRSRLERLRNEFTPPSGSFERLGKLQDRKRRRQRMLALIVGLLVGGGAALSATLIALRSGGPPPGSDPTPSGYYVRLPDEPSRTDDSGMMILEATTNLPEGTRVEIAGGGPDIEGVSSGNAVNNGTIEIRIVMNACRKVEGELKAPETRVSVIVAPSSTFVRGPAYSVRPRPDPLWQPAAVRAVLGDRFENLEGEQVQSDGQGNFISVSKTYHFPPETCTHFLVDTPGGGLRQIPLTPPLEGVEQTFQWCPDVSEALPLDGADREEAASVALRFDDSISDDDGDYLDLADRVVQFPSDWFAARGQEPGLSEVAVIAGIPGTAGEAVERSCGPGVAEKTWQVVLGDGEYELALVSYYLVLRPEGWKVWGTLEGHGEVSPPY